MVNYRITLILSFTTILQLTFVTSNKKIREVNCENIICSDCWEPVCAYNGNCYKTFNNTCQVIVENCNVDKELTFKVIHEGECNFENTPPCPLKCDFLCPPQYNPVCGCNNVHCKTFESVCFILLENCQNNENYTMKRQGECCSNESEA